MAKTRSPNYPAISLAEAIDKVKKIYKAEHLHPATDEVIAKALNYVSLNGRSMGVISAIKKYGLLVPENEGYRVSNDAVDIIESPPESPDRVRAIEKAAFTPQLFAELHETYGKQLPSDSNLRHFLIKKKFNPNAADEVIKLYRDTLELVTQLSPEYNAADAVRDEDKQESTPAGVQRMSQPLPKPTEGAFAIRNDRRGFTQPQNDYTTSYPPGMLFPLYLSRDKQGVLVVPWLLSMPEWELLKTQITHSLAIAEATVVVKDEPPTRAELEQARGTGTLEAIGGGENGTLNT